MITAIETALVVDDDTLMREFVVETLIREKIEVVQASSGTQARALMNKREFDMAFVDIKMPGLSGMDLLRWQREAEVSTLTVMITAFGTVEQAVEAMKLGAVDFLMKPFSPEQVEMALNRAREWVRLHAQNQYLREEMGLSMPAGRRLLGRSETMQSVMRQIERVAQSDSTALISGESGTGKELVAQAIHGLSDRRERPYVRMNCAAVPETLADSELFGHEKGAFTGAIARRAGRFELAADGTLLLDEISEMPLNLQAKLLRVVQEREFERVGGTRIMRAHCRIIATTNRDLQQEVEAGTFRKDLYYRLNVIPIHIPPLRERPEDILLLADTFLERFQSGKRAGDQPLRFSDDVREALTRYDWPGNVRELEHFVERLCVMESGPELTRNVLSPEFFSYTGDRQPVSSNYTTTATSPSPAETSGPRCLADVEREAIIETLAYTDGQRNRAADMLGISIRTLRNKLSAYREEGTLPAAFQ